MKSTTKKAAAPRVKAEVSAPASEFESMRAAALVEQDPDTAAAYAREALAEFITAEQAGERAAVIASFAAYRCLKAGILVEGKKPEDAAEGVMDAAEYAAAWITPKHPEGVSKASVTTWLRAGEAFALGLDPESKPAYALLGGLAQSSAWVEQRKALKEADPEAITVEVVEAAVEVAREKEVARKAAAKAKKAEQSAKDAAEPKSPLAAIQAILAGMPVEEAHALLAEAGAWLDSEAEAA